MRRREVIASLAGLASLGASPWARSESEKSIVLGQSAPLSGPFEPLGTQYNQGARLFFDALNAKGGVNGRRIELRVLDDGYDAERCAANTRRFIKDDVFALFGYVGTATSVAALQLATEAKTLLFAPQTGARSLRAPFNRYVTHIRASNYDETAAIIKQTTSVGIKKIAVFYQNDTLGNAGLEGVVLAMAPLNMTPVAVGSVEQGATDVSQAVKDIVSKQPEAIIQIGAHKECANFVRAARQAGYGGNFYNVSFVGTQLLAAELGTAARGVIVSQVMPFPFAPTTPIAKEYLAATQNLGTSQLAPSYSGIEGYIAAKAFTEVVRQTGKSLSRESFLNTVFAMDNYDLGGLSLDFSKRPNAGSKFVEMTMLTEDGRVRR